MKRGRMNYQFIRPKFSFKLHSFICTSNLDNLNLNIILTSKLSDTDNCILPEITASLTLQWQENDERHGF